MANRTHVPKFGIWDSDTPGAYTAVFDSARAGKGGKPINPNDPAENPDLAAALPPSSRGVSNRGSERPPAENPDLAAALPPSSRGVSNRGTERPPRRAVNPSDPEDGSGMVPRPRHERRASREEVDMRRQMESPGRYPYGDPSTRKPPGDSPPHRSQGDNAPRFGGRGGPGAGALRTTTSDAPRRGAIDRENGSSHSSERANGEGSNHQSERSPVHQSYQGRLGGKHGGASPAWEARKRSASGDEGSGFAPGTPTRSRLRVSRAEDPPEKGAGLPKFGEWNANDPTSGDGFTMIFNNARNEKKEGGPVRIPQLQTDSPSRPTEDRYKQPNYGVQKQRSSQKSSFFCCFRPDVET